MIKQTIQEQLKDAMRAKEATKLETLRYILSELKYEEIEKHRELSDDESLAVLSREVKKRKDAIEMFRSSGRNELVTLEEQKLTYISALLPQQLSEEELQKIVGEVIDSSTDKSFGSVMKEVMNRVRGKADGRMVSEAVKLKLS